MSPIQARRRSLIALGSNWIPADNFLTTLTAERYRAWLVLLRDGNQNMVRVWGGGIYEPDCFYDICDGSLGSVFLVFLLISSRVGHPCLAGFPIRVRRVSRARRVLRVGGEGG